MAIVKKAIDRSEIPNKCVDRIIPATYAKMKRKVATSQGRINHLEFLADPYINIILKWLIVMHLMTLTTIFVLYLHMR